MSQKSADLLSCILLHLGGDMTAGVLGEAIGIMPKQTRQGLHIHAILEGQRCEGMPQIVESNLLHSAAFRQSLETFSLVLGSRIPPEGEQMNGMSLREMDQIIYSVCRLCRDHERSGFVEGIKIGIQFASELE